MCMVWCCYYSEGQRVRTAAVCTPPVGDHSVLHPWLIASVLRSASLPQLVSEVGSFASDSVKTHAVWWRTE